MTWKKYGNQAPRKEASSDPDDDSVSLWRVGKFFGNAAVDAARTGAKGAKNSVKSIAKEYQVAKEDPEGYVREHKIDKSILDSIPGGKYTAGALVSLAALGAAALAYTMYKKNKEKKDYGDEVVLAIKPHEKAASIHSVKHAVKKAAFDGVRAGIALGRDEKIAEVINDAAAQFGGRMGVIQNAVTAASLHVSNGSGEKRASIDDAEKAAHIAGLLIGMALS